MHHMDDFEIKVYCSNESKQTHETNLSKYSNVIVENSKFTLDKMITIVKNMP